MTAREIDIHFIEMDGSLSLEMHPRDQTIPAAVLQQQENNSLHLAISTSDLYTSQRKLFLPLFCEKERISTILQFCIVFCEHSSKILYDMRVLFKKLLEIAPQPIKRSTSP